MTGTRALGFYSGRTSGPSAVGASRTATNGPRWSLSADILIANTRAAAYDGRCRPLRSRRATYHHLQKAPHASFRLISTDGRTGAGLSYQGGSSCTSTQRRECTRTGTSSRDARRISQTLCTAPLAGARRCKGTRRAHRCGPPRVNGGRGTRRRGARGQDDHDAERRTYDDCHASAHLSIQRKKRT